ncbi:MAG: redoxin domain-containing protein [Candidatus Azobacteroides sp.]|nr:redoxin domain-containing protein [Candidatus Azobacteroides sp.]
MKVKIFFYILLCILVLVSCSKEDSFLVEGNITGLTQSAIYIVTTFGNETKVDTILSKDGKFEYVSSYDSVKPVVIYMEEKSVWITVWVQNGETVKISGNVNYPELIETTGNEINNLLTEFRQDNKEAIKERAAWHDKDHPQNSEWDRTIRQNVGQFIKEHPSSVASLVLMLDYLIDNENTQVLGDYLSLIESPAKEDPLYSRLNAAYNRLVQTSVGKPAPDFSMVDSKGDSLTLQSFKGAYLLLIFENSTCEACKNDYPALKKIYTEYNKKKIQLLSFVFDENSNIRKNISDEFDIKWQQVIDKYGLASPLLTLYNVDAIPDYYLIDKEGKIAASHVSIEKIQQLLKDYIK